MGSSSSKKDTSDKYTPRITSSSSLSDTKRSYSSVTPRIRTETSQKHPSDILKYDKKRLEEIQLKVIQVMHDKCKPQHDNLIITIGERLKNLGFNAKDSYKLFQYIKFEAPIIVHVHLDRDLVHLVKDTHYRSQFQTNKSSGTLNRDSRIAWENRLFDNFYNKATDFQRVKYGTLNFPRDPKGIKACLGYGKSHFVLKHRVRQRCTFTNKDSSYADSLIGTLSFSFKVVNNLKDKQLKVAMEAALGKEGDSACVKPYKQVQIHGPVRFNKDIFEVVVSREEVPQGSVIEILLNKFLKENNNLKHRFI